MQRTLGPFFILALPIQHVLLPMIGKEEFETSIKIVRELYCSLFIGNYWPSDQSLVLKSGVTLGTNIIGD
jgi:hypothetical protein